MIRLLAQRVHGTYVSQYCVETELYEDMLNSYRGRLKCCNVNSRGNDTDDRRSGVRKYPTLSGRSVSAMSSK